MKIVRQLTLCDLLVDDTIRATEIITIIPFDNTDKCAESSIRCFVYILFIDGTGKNKTKYYILLQHNRIVYAIDSFAKEKQERKIIKINQLTH